MPEKLRSRIGAYYTPPELVNRMINYITNTGFNWGESKIVDPACGGAAFLGSIARFIVNQYKSTKTPTEIVNIINSNLEGFEIDPFAAWISQSLLEITIFHHLKDTSLEISNIVKVRDSLLIDSSEYETYDLVIGNPPYGKIKLDSTLRGNYERSVYGHANLYGLFTDLSIRLTKKHGFISFVTPVDSRIIFGVVPGKFLLRRWKKQERIPHYFCA